MENSKWMVTVIAIVAAAQPILSPPASAQSLVEIEKVFANDGFVDDGFGAAVDISGDTAVIGSQDDAAYIYVKSGDNWEYQATLIKNEGLLDFGGSVAISGDTVVVGSVRSSGTGDGSAYVYVRDGTSWTEQAKLGANDGTINAEFGDVVDISGDTVIVGASRDDSQAGSAFVFVREGTTWTQQDKLLPEARFGRFGISVAIEGDVAVVGAFLDDNTQRDSGSAFVFARNGSGWSQTAKLIAFDGRQDDDFGRSVAVSGDTIIVGAPADDHGTTTNAGSAYVFVRSASNWQLQKKLVASDPGEADTFGRRVALSGDTALIGSYLHDELASGAGAVYRFVRTSSNWSERAKLFASDGAANDFFGSSVAISGSMAVVGADGDDNALGTGIGAAYFFRPEILTSSLYGIDNAFLSKIDRQTGTMISSVTLNVPGDPLPGTASGLAVNPITNEMYAVVKLLVLGDACNQNLVKINPYTGTAALVGRMNQPVSSLAFDSAGVLYAVSGDFEGSCTGATLETIFAVNVNDATLTPFQTLGNGGSGEAIAYNPDDGLMYHLSGQGVGVIFESIELSDGTITSIPLSGDATANLLLNGFVFDTFRDVFVGSMSDLQDVVYVSLTPNGSFSNLGTLGLNWNHFAFFNVSNIDADSDGIPDIGDAFPNDANEWADFDNDGVGDNADDFPYDPEETVDSDGDGVGDNSDAFPSDPDETVDTDGDGIGNNMDTDDDNDGVADSEDEYPLGQFSDAPPGSFAFSFIEALARAGITSGCGNGNYCPSDAVSRAQMAVFLERGINGSGYTPPAATGNVFLDVGAGDFAANFIEQLASDGITAGCGNNNYCPDAEVTRAQMAVFLLRAKYGASYSPPAATGVFGDVDLGYWAVHWIEQLAAEGITAGCGNNNYCPTDPVTRDQMAVFLVRTFGL